MFTVARVAYASLRRFLSSSLLFFFPPVSLRFSRKVWYERFEGLTLAEFVVSKTGSNICPINNRRKIANITKVHFLDVLKKMDFVTPVFFTELSSVFLSIEPNRRPSVRPSVHRANGRPVSFFNRVPLIEFLAHYTQSGRYQFFNG